MPSNTLDTLKRICVRVTTKTDRLTGFFVSHDLVATCAHGLRAHKDGIKITVGDGSERTECDATIVAIDATQDVAILRASVATTATLFALDGTASVDSRHLCYGFPSVAEGAGVPLGGEVIDPNASDTRGQSAIQLFSPAIVAAGDGMRGFSGSPVVVDGKIVGQLRRIIVDALEQPGNAKFGVVYATPASVIRSMAKLSDSVVALPDDRLGSYSSESYIARPDVEELAARYLTGPGRPVVIEGPFRSGKTWLLHRIVEQWRLANPKGQLVRIDLRELAGEMDNIHQFARSLALAILESRDESPEELQEYWTDVAAPLTKLKRFLRGHLLERSSSDTLLAFDNVDVALGCSAADDFFGAIRSWVETVGVGAQWAKLRVILSISTTPTQLIKTPNLSPFNITDPLSVRSFPVEDLRKLAGMHGVTASDPHVAALHKLTGGHPYLCRRALAAARRQSAGLESVLDRGNDDCFLPHLRMIRLFLEQSGLKATTAAVFRGQRIRDQLSLDRLLRANLVRREGTQVVPSCELYGELFGALAS